MMYTGKLHVMYMPDFILMLALYILVFSLQKDAILDDELFDAFKEWIESKLSDNSEAVVCIPWLRMEHLKKLW